MTRAVPGGMQGFNEAMIEDVRANGHPTKGPFVGRSVLVLTTTGAKSGESRSHPLVYSRDGDRYIIIASKGGAPTNPDWYHNLRANPLVTVELGTERFQARATPVTDEAEYERLYTQQATQMPGFAEYRKKTTRRIPVILLERVQ